jgi:hypothetical protein
MLFLWPCFRLASILQILFKPCRVNNLKILVVIQGEIIFYFSLWIGIMYMTDPCDLPEMMRNLISFFQYWCLYYLSSLSRFLSFTISILWLFLFPYHSNIQGLGFPHILAPVVNSWVSFTVCLQWKNIVWIFSVS